MASSATTDLTSKKYQTGTFIVGIILSALALGAIAYAVSKGVKLGQK